MQSGHTIRVTIFSILLIATLLLFLGSPGSDIPRSIAALWNCGHIGYFFLLSSLLLQHRRIAGLSPAAQWVIVLGITLLAGSAIELVQHFTQRDAEIGDVIRDLTGSLVLLAWRSQPVSGRYPASRPASRVLAASVLLVMLLPLLRSVADESIARQQFPLLAGFETPLETDRLELAAGTHASRTVLPDDRHVLKVQLSTRRYSGVGMRFFPGDWSHYQALALDIYNPDSTPLTLTCRVHDQAHQFGDHAYNDRFNQTYVLVAGWNRIRMDLEKIALAPAHRRMDLQRIRGFGCYAGNLPAPREIYLDNLRLSDQPYEQ